MQLISQNIDSFDLIDNSIAVATITGQSGWEALTNKKPVIYFGDVWYKGAPGSININDFYNLSKTKRKKVFNYNFSTDINKWYNEFLSRSVPGYISSILGNSWEKNNHKITVEFINKYLKQCDL